MRVDASSVLAIVGVLTLVDIRAIAPGVIKFITPVAYAPEHTENVFAPGTMVRVRGIG